MIVKKTFHVTCGVAENEVDLVLSSAGLWLMYDDLTDVIRVTVSTGEQRNSRLRGTEEQ